MTKKLFFIILCLLFIGNTCLVTYDNLPAVFSLILVTIGHSLFFIFGKTTKQIFVNISIGSFSIIYFIVFKPLHIGLVNNLIYAIVYYGVYSFLKKDLSKNIC
ncbi:hypothetical protein GMA11_06435 [Granulicatella sp. zg-ZJ]|uniref:hypothetical protein n=1 Tax=unclassified Granulicatella TaxID=2630493 RepID=UPI0013C27BA2|nr:MULTISPECIES: hypothetical protein [unclassified Granulicatella]MBS4749844.1 hypothetical protein [Carnobacteriaceae bacterium zg-ZUI78]NEW63030.1 hypothetical protein [Granulicatella sp. zg-ZJ]NEW66217.1 hypothetical protein [Granulicatella sp. zg-84]QMI85941.1 hypothetical protein H1220_00785 [Carnobacteriaceae bacterium zg-84]